MPRLSTIILVGGVLLLLFGFAGSGLHAGFTHDDLMNAATALRYPVAVHVRDILLFFTHGSTFRPAGSLLYVLLFDVFGFTPLPYRVACYALLTANLLLAFRLAFQLTGSRRMAALTVLLFAYHGNFWNFYVNTGLCYDLLCFFFCAAAYLYYLCARREGRAGAWPQVAAWSALYILALNSKEIAVSLPVIILAWEFLNNSRRLSLQDVRIPLAGAGITAAFVIGRVFGPQGISAAGGYHVELSAAQYFGHALQFLSLALYEPRWLTPAAAVALVAAVLAAAAYLRMPALSICLFWVAIGILPVAFIMQRTLDAVYLPAFAFGVCISVLTVTTVERLLPRWTPAGLAASVVLLVTWHVHNGLFELNPRQEDSRRIASALDWFRARQVRFAPGSKTLFLRDPFPGNPYASQFLLQLYSKDASLWVGRLDRVGIDWPADQSSTFAHVFTFDQDRMLLCDASSFVGVTGHSLATIAAGHLACR